MLASTALIICVLTTPAFAYLIRRHLLRPGSEPLVFMLACIFAYFTLLFSIPIRRAEIEQAAAAYDVADTSPQAETARRRISNDTGLTLAPITGLAIIPFWCVIVYAFMGTVHWVGALVVRKPRSGEPIDEPKSRSRRF
ncbi:hypothetical protein [Allorhodopirellula heiligendammensis]|uniref:hypothetical protein n=1 Tax=Allorhodopirellula heiligendammensis TaxID=2714739 RepID=UPI00265DCF95|nr:hypothetical protein [Allorhodopirellula heiligendammensis]